MQIPSHVPRPAAYVTQGTAAGSCCREPVEKFTIERLVPQFVEDPARVLIGDAVVVLTEGVR